MLDENPRLKRNRLLYEGVLNEKPDAILPADGEISKENRQLVDANQEWRRFYEVIKQATRDMRY